MRLNIVRIQEDANKLASAAMSRGRRKRALRVNEHSRLIVAALK